MNPYINQRLDILLLLRMFGLAALARTLCTSTKALTAQFEHTILITEDGHEAGTSRFFGSFRIKTDKIWWFQWFQYKQKCSFVGFRPFFHDLSIETVFELDKNGALINSTICPESVWAKGSSNSRGLLYIFICSHLHVFTSSSHLHHFFSSSDLLIFITSSSHLLIFTYSHVYIISSSLSLLLSLSFSLSFSLLLSLSFSLSLSLCLSLSVSLSLFPFPLARSLSFFPSYFLSLGGGQCWWGATKWPPFRTKWGLSRKTEINLRFSIVRGNPFARNDVGVSKTEGFLRVWLVRPQPFRRNEVRVSKTEVNLRFWNFCCATFSHETRFECQKLNVFCEFSKFVCVKAFVCKSFCA